MYSHHQSMQFNPVQQALHFEDSDEDSGVSVGSSPQEEESETISQLGYAKILQWSVDKLSPAPRAGGGGGHRRRRSQSDLRRTLLIASAMSKARAGMLHERALKFLEAKPQLQPPTNFHQQQVPAAVVAEKTPEEEEEVQIQVEEVQEQETVFDRAIEDPLSASAEAIVMSSVELSIQDLDTPPSLPTPPSSTPPTPQAFSRKRKQPEQTVSKRTRPEQEAVEQGSELDGSETPPVARLQASFLDLTMSSGGRPAGSTTPTPPPAAWPWAGWPTTAEASAPPTLGCRQAAAAFGLGEPHSFYGGLYGQSVSGPFECHAFA